MKRNKKFIAGGSVRLSVVIAATMIIVGATLSLAMYLLIQKSFFQATVRHEIELTRIMESLGIQLIDSRLRDLKAEMENLADQYGEVLTADADNEKETLLSDIRLGEYNLNYCYQTREQLFCGDQFQSDYVAQLDLSDAWKGNTVVFAPDFDEEGNYILAAAAPVFGEQKTIEGILIGQLDGYCISQWIGKAYLSMDFGTSYIIDGSGRNIATAKEENYDWITTRYNAQELARETADENTLGIAKLEKQALDGKTGIDTYVWEGSTNYVAYGPLTETNWGFFVGFYGNEFKKYSQEMTSISSRAAGVMLTAFSLFAGTIIIVFMRNLKKERSLNERLTRQNIEIEQQALRIAASEERFRIAMQRSRDMILEYQIETGNIICFHEGREIKSGRLGDDALRKYIIEDCCMDEDSFKRFEGVMQAIGKGLTSAECVVSGDRGEGRRWYSMSLSAAPGVSGMPTRAFGILRDVTGEREAELDSLTKLLNKAAVTNTIQTAMQKNLPETVSAFVMLDVDYFKLVNDKYGHPAGDRTLCLIADYLRQFFPAPYLTGRFGGDEFCIYCPSKADYGELKNRLERLCAQAKKIKGQDGKTLDISLSIGAVIFHGRAQFEKVYKKADEMLYEMKENGRDGHRIYQEKQKGIFE